MDLGVGRFAVNHCMKRLNLIRTNRICKGNFKKGEPSWNKGKKCPQFAGVNNPMYGKHFKHTEETKLKMVIKLRERMKNPELVRKCLARRDKSSLELKFEEIFLELNLPYKFVGNGDFIMEGKCPDFININGQKIAIEVYYRRHKDKFSGGIEMWKQNRLNIFDRYGWKLIFMDETESNKLSVLSKLGGD